MEFRKQFLWHGEACWLVCRSHDQIFILESTVFSQPLPLVWWQSWSWRAFSANQKGFLDWRQHLRASGCWWAAQMGRSGFVLYGHILVLLLLLFKGMVISYVWGWGARLILGSLWIILFLAFILVAVFIRCWRYVMLWSRTTLIFQEILMPEFDVEDSDIQALLCMVVAQVECWDSCFWGFSRSCHNK